MQRRQSGSQFAIEPVTSQGANDRSNASKQFPTTASVAATVTATFVATAAADNDHNRNNDRIHSHDHDIVSTHRPNDQVP